MEISVFQTHGSGLSWQVNGVVDAENAVTEQTYTNTLMNMCVIFDVSLAVQSTHSGLTAIDNQAVKEKNKHATVMDCGIHIEKDQSFGVQNTRQAQPMKTTETYTNQALFTPEHHKKFSTKARPQLAVG